MDVICGTDFSSPALAAGEVAAGIARSQGAPLRLIYAIDQTATAGIFGGVTELVVASVRDRLTNEAERLRATGVEVHEELVHGVPDEELIRLSKESSDRLIVVAATGWRSAPFWTLGGVAERTARGAACPVLVVRDGASLNAWLNGERPLRVLVGVDLSAASEAPVRWISQLRKAGPCEVRFSHIFSPVEEMGRLGIRGSLADADPELKSTLTEELALRIRAAGEPDPSIIVRGNLGRPADPLIDLVSEEAADLLIVATRQISPLERTWRGSVSYTALHLSPSSVATVPAGEALGAQTVPRLERILAASDGSEGGRLAIGYALAIAPAGAVVHLIRVVGSDCTAEDRESAKRSLLEGVSREHAGRAEVEVVVSDDPAKAICHAAERTHADVICIATRGRSVIARTLLGSVSEAVAASSRRPVLIVHPGKAAQ